MLRWMAPWLRIILSVRVSETEGDNTLCILVMSHGSGRLQNHIPPPAPFGPSPLPLSWKWRCSARPSGSQGPLRGRTDTLKSPGMVSQASRCVCVCVGRSDWFVCCRLKIAGIGSWRWLTPSSQQVHHSYLLSTVSTRSLAIRNYTEEVQECREKEC